MSVKEFATLVMLVGCIANSIIARMQGRAETPQSSNSSWAQARHNHAFSWPMDGSSRRPSLQSVNINATRTEAMSLHMHRRAVCCRSLVGRSRNVAGLLYLHVLTLERASRGQH